MKHLIILLCYFMSVILSAKAQNPSTIVFNNEIHDFGTFPEDGDNQTYDFQFINKGKNPVAIVYVYTTCGCTVANYTRKPVFPGKTGVVSVTYNPQGRPGKFNRSVLIDFGDANKKVKLCISGMVTPGVERKDKRYPYVIGDLQLRTNALKFTPVKGYEQELEIQVINSGKFPLRTEVHSSDSALSGYMEPGILSPGESGELKISSKPGEKEARVKCVRLKEDKAHPQKKGYLFIEIAIEKCN